VYMNMVIPLTEYKIMKKYMKILRILLVKNCNKINDKIVKGLLLLTHTVSIIVHILYFKAYTVYKHVQDDAGKI
jgi:hypothetical protein